MSDDSGAARKGRVPVWYWVIAVLALLWNLGGVAAFVGQMVDLEASVQSLPEENRQAILDLLKSAPAWTTVAFAVAVFGGVLGSIGLLARQKWALLMFVLSAVAVLIQHGYAFLMTEMLSLLRSTDLILPILVVVLDVALVAFSWLANKRGWLS